MAAIRATGPQPDGDREGGRAAPTLDRLVAESASTRAAIALAARAAASEIPLLFEGESGVGKEVFARAVHAGSPRADGPFVAVNCGALPEALVESTLFGHERGAFTGAVERRPGRFAEADGGVLFLDEIGELPLQAQVKLLRAVQEREIDPVGAARPRRIDIRLIAATNRDLKAEVAAGRFREDLYYRIAAFPVRVPPLRERRADIAPLARTLIARIAEVEGALPPSLSPCALAGLEAADWPGNVRELENALHRAFVMAGGGPLTGACFAPQKAAAPHGEAAARRADPAQRGPVAADPVAIRSLAEVEADHIRLAVATCAGLAEAARRLGISRSTLYRKMETLGMAARDASGPRGD